jgi:hypothetical protein
MMFRFWSRRAPSKPLLVSTQFREAEAVPERSGKAAAQKRSAADSDGTVRRMRQAVENNRLL